MERDIAWCCFAGLLWVGCGGNDGGAPDAGPASPLDRLRAESTGPFAVRTDTAGRVRTLRARIASRGPDPEARARTFVGDHAELFGVADVAADLFVERVSADGRYVVFGRRVGLVPVFAAEIRVYLDVDGAVRWVSTVLPTDPEGAARSAAIDADAATTALAAELGAPVASLRMGVPQLVILDVAMLDGRSGPSALAWAMDAAGSTPEQAVRGFVDAVSGRVLWLAPQAPGVLSRTIYDAAHVGDMGQLQDDVLLDVLAPLFSESSPSTFPPRTETDGWNAFENLGHVHGYFLATFGRDGWNGDGRVAAFVHYAAPDHMNSYYSSGRADLLHEPALYFADAEPALDTVVHEYTHGVVAATARLLNTFEPGALNESIADVFAAFMDLDTPWTLGDGSSTGVIRDLADPTRFGDPRRYTLRRTANEGACSAMEPRCVVGRCLDQRCWRDAGWVHDNAGIPNHAAYLLTVGGVHADTHVAVRGLGADKVARLWYTALADHAGSAHQMLDWRDDVVAACLLDLAGRTIDGITFEHRDCGAVMNAFAAVELGPADPDEDGVEQEFDNCPDVYNPEQADGDCPVPPSDAGLGPDAGVVAADSGSPAPGVICPRVFPTDSSGDWPLVLEDGPNDTRTSGIYPRTVTCRYASPGSRLAILSAWWNEATTSVLGTGCFAETLVAGQSVCSATRQATVVVASYGDGVEDAAELRFADTLLARVEASALVCPGITAGACDVAAISCPADVAVASGPVPLSPLTRLCPVPASPTTQERAWCKYEAQVCGNRTVTPGGSPPPGTPTAPSFWLSWAELPGQMLVGSLRGPCTDGATYMFAGNAIYPSMTSQAEVAVSPDDGSNPALAARARELLAQIEGRALACP